MKETNFINNNKDKWEHFEKIISSKNINPDEISDSFIEITNDLSYSRSFFPNRSITVYLNSISQKVFLKLYKSKSIKQKKFITFWSKEIPLLIYHSRKEFLLSFLVFLTGLIIGWHSSSKSPDFIENILGNGYVSMSKANIKSGDPMAVYKDKDKTNMFLGITINNIRVAFFCFILGIFLGIGSIFFILYNGIMLGTFLYFFNTHNLFLVTSVTVWQHGTLEITSIIIAGAAGIVLGKGFMFPNTYSRIQSFYISAQRGTKLLLSTLPVFVLAAIIESYITRYTDTPVMMRVLIIILSLLFILFYYIFLPYKIAHSNVIQTIKTEALPTTEKVEITLLREKKTNELFYETIIVFRDNFKSIFQISSILSLIYILIILLFTDRTVFDFENNYYSKIYAPFKGLNCLFIEGSWQVYAGIIIIFSYILFYSILILKNLSHKQSSVSIFSNASKFISIKTIPLLLVFSSILFLLWLDVTLLTVIYVILFPFIILSIYIHSVDNTDIIETFERLYFLIRKRIFKIYLVFIPLVILSAIFLILFTTPIFYMYTSFFKMLLPLFEGASYHFLNILNSFILLTILIMLLPAIFISIGLFYYSLVEIQDAPVLKGKIKNLIERKLKK